MLNAINELIGIIYLCLHAYAIRLSNVLKNSLRTSMHSSYTSTSKPATTKGGRFKVRYNALVSDP